MTSWKGRPRSEAKPRGLSPCIASSDHGVLRTSHRTAPRHGPTIRLHSLLRHVTLSLARPPPRPGLTQLGECPLMSTCSIGSVM